MGWPRTSVASGAPSAISGASHGRHRDLSRRRSLRAGLAALALILLAPAGAVAADMPEFLRGSYSPSSTRWDGFYFGAQAGKTFGSADFSNVDRFHDQLHSGQHGVADHRLRLDDIAERFDRQPKLWRLHRLQLPVGRRRIGRRAELQPYVAWNWPAGFDRTYSGSGRQPSPDGSTVLYNVTVASAASVAIHDIVTARARAGWAFDRFMPYGFAGLAVGRADVSRFATWPAAPKQQHRLRRLPVHPEPARVHWICRVTRNRNRKAAWLPTALPPGSESKSRCCKICLLAPNGNSSSSPISATFACRRTPRASLSG